MGFWSELGKAAASSILSEMESTARKASRMTDDPEKAESRMRAADSARRLRNEYFDDD